MKRFSLIILFIAFPVFAAAGHTHSESLTACVLLSRDLEPHRQALQGFTKKLLEMGIELSIDEYVLDGDKEMEEKIAQRAFQKKPDFILALGSRAAAIGKKLSPGIPVVFANVLNPRASGLIKDFSSPPDLISGASLDIYPREKLKVLKSLLPDAKRIGILYHSPSLEPLIHEIQAEAEDNGFSVQAIKLKDLGQMPEALEDLISKIDVFWMVADTDIFNPQSTRYILLQTLRSRIPFIGLSPSYVKAGALFCLYWDSVDIGEQAAALVPKIAGDHLPAPVPVTRPRRTTLHINKHVASNLKIRIPTTLKESMIVD